MAEFKFICLANSRKLSGRCVAGKLLDGNWIRPVSARNEGELSEEERRYEDGSDPQLLDLITLQIIGPRPKDYQTENILIDDGFYWVRNQRVAWEALPPYVDKVAGPLWANNSHTYHGFNDKVTLEHATGFNYSLRFIHVQQLSLRVFATGAAFGNHKRSVQATFSWMGENYKLKVTDPAIEAFYFARDEEHHQLPESFLTISLSEPSPHDNCCYKLVAAVITRDRAIQ